MDTNATAHESRNEIMDEETAEDIQTLCVRADSVMASDGCRWIDIRTLNGKSEHDVLPMMCIDSLPPDMLMMTPGNDNFVRVTDAAMAKAVEVLCHIRPALTLSDSMLPAPELQDLISKSFMAYREANLRARDAEPRPRPMTQEEFDHGVATGQLVPLNDGEPYELDPSVWQKIRMASALNQR